jgi:hypothetical protein
VINFDAMDFFWFSRQDLHNRIAFLVSVITSCFVSL